MKENIDELDYYLCEQIEPDEGESVKMEHVMREKNNYKSWSKKASKDSRSIR